MRLLAITNRYPANHDDPASPFLPGIIAALRAEGAEVRIVTPDYGFRPDVDAHLVRRFAATPDGRLVGSLRPWWPPDLPPLVRMLSRWREAVLDEAAGHAPEALLAFWALPSGWIARQAAARLRIPYAVWCLGSDVLVWGRRPLTRRFVHAVLRDASHRWADGLDISARAARLGRCDCEYLPSFRVLPESGPAPAELPEGGRVVTMIGRLERSKGVPVFIDAMRTVLPDEPDLHACVTGWGTLEEAVRSAAAEPAMDRRFHYLGRVPADTLATLLRASSCCVIPTHLDSVPLVFGEAVQAGAPLVVSSYGDLPELVERYRLGTVFRSGSATDLARAVREVIADPRSFADPEGRSRFIADSAPAVSARRIMTALGTVVGHA